MKIDFYLLGILEITEGITLGQILFLAFVGFVIYIFYKSNKESKQWEKQRKELMEQLEYEAEERKRKAEREREQIYQQEEEKRLQDEARKAPVLAWLNDNNPVLVEKVRSMDATMMNMLDRGIDVTDYEDKETKAFVMSELLAVNATDFEDKEAAAFVISELLAIVGSAEHMSNLSLFYEKGIGVSKDATKSGVWEKKAADNGHALSQLSCGVHYYNMELYDSAREYLEKAFNNPNAGTEVRITAQRYLGQLQDEPKATHNKPILHELIGEQMKVGYYYGSRLLGILEKTEQGYSYTSNTVNEKVLSDRWLLFSGEYPLFNSYKKTSNILFPDFKRILFNEDVFAGAKIFGFEHNSKWGIRKDIMERAKISSDDTEWDVLVKLSKLSWFPSNGFYVSQIE